MCPRDHPPGISPVSRTTGRFICRIRAVSGVGGVGIPRGLTVHTEFATYTIPVEPSEDLHGHPTIDVDDARDLRITCAVTGESFTVTESVLPRSLRDMVYESIGRTWADTHGTA